MDGRPFQGSVLDICAEGVMVESVAEKAKAFVQPERLAATLMELIDVPSPTGSEQQLAELICEKMAGFGLHTELQEVEAGQSNAVCRLQGNSSGISLLLLGHMDTTWSGSEEGIRERGLGFQPVARRDGDWIYGMGANNMKCGIAAIIEAVSAVVEANVPLKGDVVVAGVVGESPKIPVGRYRGIGFRGAGKGVRHLVNNGVIADLCVVAESTAGQISTESGGYVYLEVETSGNPGATYFRRGAEAEVRERNAIERMNDVLERLHEWGEKYVQRSRSGNGVPTHFSLVSFEGGLAYRPSKEPALCRATIEVGVKPGQSLVDVVHDVRDCVRSSGVETASVRLLQAVPGASVTPDEPVVTHLGSAHMREFGELPSLTSDGWLADTSHLTRYGIPSVCYSTAGRVREGGANYYPLGGEQCNLPDLTRGARVFADLVASVGQLSRDELPNVGPATRGTVVL